MGPRAAGTAGPIAGLDPGTIPTWVVLAEIPIRALVSPVTVCRERHVGGEALRGASWEEFDMRRMIVLIGDWFARSLRAGGRGFSA